LIDFLKRTFSNYKKMKCFTGVFSQNRKIFLILQKQIF